MNCAYHSQNVANVQCNGCGKPLCPACDHRIKGFPYCQDCIVTGVDLLRQQNQSNYVPYVKKRTSPFVATLLSFCPGLGAAYNGQTVKALVHFAVFVGLFQMAILTGGMVIFVFGIIGMWLFAALDAWRSAQAIRSGLTPDIAEDILVKRFSGNPKLWGAVLMVLGVAFFFRDTLKQTGIVKAVLPLLLIGLGIYILRGYVFKPKTDEQRWQDIDTKSSPTFVSALSEPRYRTGDFENRGESRYGGGWQGR